MDVSTILVNYNGLNVLRRCLASLQKLHSASTFEIIVVDNASDDDSVPTLKKEFKKIRVIENSTNAGFGAACNIGAAQASGKYLFFLNPDTVVNHDVVFPLTKFLDSQPQAGVVGPKIVNDDGTFQLSCGRLPSIAQEAIDKVIYSLARSENSNLGAKLETRYSGNMTVEWVTGAALMIRAELFHSLGGFDSGMFMYFEDKDLCKRVRDKGFDVWYIPSVSVVHSLGKGSPSSSAGRLREIYRASQRYYYRKHHGMLQRWLLALYQGVSR